MSKRIATFTWIVLAVAIVSAAMIAAFDIGGSAPGRSGAGDIWWVDVPEVEQSYRNTLNSK